MLVLGDAHADGGAVVGEEPSSLAEHGGGDDQADLVDQAGGQQRLRESGRAVQLELASRAGP